MKSKKNLESLKNNLFSLEINSPMIFGGGKLLGCWVESASLDIYDYYPDDRLKPEPTFGSGK